MSLPLARLRSAAGLLHMGASRWRRATRSLRVRIEAARIPVAPAVFDPAEVTDLPSPVQRFFETVLTPGQPVVTEVRIEHAGTFNMGASEERWRRFASVQWVVTNRPGFVWDARVGVLPGLPVRVHDAYVAGDGILRASLAGLVQVADAPGSEELARGELVRYLAEAAWYPTALLPGRGVSWQAADDASAYATLRDAGVTVMLRFRFAASGPIESVFAAARGRTVGSEVVPTPWEGRWKDYSARNGMEIPLRGEVAWLAPQGVVPYWRGHLTRIDYRFAV